MLGGGGMRTAGDIKIFYSLNDDKEELAIFLSYNLP